MPKKTKAQRIKKLVHQAKLKAFSKQSHGDVETSLYWRLAETIEDLQKQVEQLEHTNGRQEMSVPE